MRVDSRSRHPATSGEVTGLCVDSENAWAATGTASGSVYLWDLRYGLLLREWSFGSAITACQLHPSYGHRKWIIISLAAARSEENSGTTLLHTLDISAGQTTETFGTFPVSEVSPMGPEDAQTAISSTKARTNFLQKLTAGETLAQPELASQTISTVLSLAVSGSAETISLSPVGENFPGNTSMVDAPVDGSAGVIVSGSNDHLIRWWNLGRPGDSVMISGLGKEAGKSYQ